MKHYLPLALSLMVLTVGAAQAADKMAVDAATNTQAKTTISEASAPGTEAQATQETKTETQVEATETTTTEESKAAPVTEHSAAPGTPAMPGHPNAQPTTGANPDAVEGQNSNVQKLFGMFHTKQQTEADATKTTTPPSTAPKNMQSPQ